jgi:hypothetical protein
LLVVGLVEVGLGVGVGVGVTTGLGTTGAGCGLGASIGTGRCGLGGWGLGVVGAGVVLLELKRFPSPAAFAVPKIIKNKKKDIFFITFTLRYYSVFI